MANQWFTGLVTPSRWDFGWLNEGIATYLEYFATATVMYFFIYKTCEPVIEIHNIDSTIENTYFFYLPSKLLFSLILIINNFYKIVNFSNGRVT